ncbi:hypothetical protein FNF27_00790 [Cafeteria roenbergensis]|uniref:Uncharacterized protein n=1 Tax=Cafeteria roenbergensis TaxID=33653 RepID=A0A5A8ENV1_CAFRO|nr:hypothetical protein FNF27_00790 [Cafeteria roenbergensis]
MADAANREATDAPSRSPPRPEPAATLAPASTGSGTGLPSRGGDEAPAASTAAAAGSDGAQSAREAASTEAVRPTLHAAAPRHMRGAAQAVFESRLEFTQHPSWMAGLRSRLARSRNSATFVVPRRRCRVASVLTWAGMALAACLLPLSVGVAFLAVGQAGDPSSLGAMRSLMAVLGIAFPLLFWPAVVRRAQLVYRHPRRLQCRSVADVVQECNSTLPCGLIETANAPEVRNWGPVLFAVVGLGLWVALCVLMAHMAVLAQRLAASGVEHTDVAMPVSEAGRWFARRGSAVALLEGVRPNQPTGAWFVDGHVRTDLAVPFCAQADNSPGTGCVSHAMAAPVIDPRRTSVSRNGTVVAVCVGRRVPASGHPGDRPANDPPLPPPGSLECIHSPWGFCGVSVALQLGVDEVDGNAYRALRESFPQQLRQPGAVVDGPPVLFCESPASVAAGIEADAELSVILLYAWTLLVPLFGFVPHMAAHMLRECGACNSAWHHHDDPMFELGATGRLFALELLTPRQRQQLERLPGLNQFCALCNLRF